MTVNMTTATSRIFDRVHRQGEEIKNDLPNWVERVVKSEGWKTVIDPSTGEPFQSVGKWLTASWPMGPGMGQGEFAITYDEFIVLCENRPALKKLLVESRPKRRPGPKSADHNEDSEPAKASKGNSRSYIESRLAREFPGIWNDYLAGKYPSARQAAIAAGFVKAPAPKSRKLVAKWQAASKAERKRLIAALDRGDEQAVAEWF